MTQLEQCGEKFAADDDSESGKQKRGHHLVSPKCVASPNGPAYTDGHGEGRVQESQNDLLTFLQSLAGCIKGNPAEFFSWITSEDITTVSDLREAVVDEDYLQTNMRARNGRAGIKGFKLGLFKKAVLATNAEAPSADRALVPDGTLPPSPTLNQNELEQFITTRYTKFFTENRSVIIAQDFIRANGPRMSLAETIHGAYNHKKDATTRWDLVRLVL